MKYTHYILSAAVALLTLGSCNTDFTPTTAISDKTLTTDDYNKLLIGVYDGLQGLANGFIIDDVSADNLDDIGWYGDYDKNQLTGSSQDLNDIWNEMFYRIQLANNLINLIEAEASPTDAEREIEAQARFLRAWFYERQCMRWGDVPLLHNVEEANNAPRTSEADVWAFAKEDLEYAVQYAPDYTTPGYISKQAAKALLARTCLLAPGAARDLSRATQLAEELIADDNFSLASDAANIWQTQNSKEMIFATINSANDGGCPGWFLRSNIVNTLKSNGVDTGYGAQGRYMFPVDNSLMNAFEEGDNRKAACVRVLTNGSTTTRDLVKFPGPDGKDPYPIVRIAEMYLISAEAQGRTAGLTRLNELRAARGLRAITPEEVPDDDSYLARIMQERRVEFVGEGLRWYDLRRWFNTNAAGKQAVLNLRCYQTGETSGSRPAASDAMNISEDGHELLWPIPTTAKDNDDNLEQNPGY